MSIDWNNCTFEDIIEERNRIHLIVENIPWLDDVAKQKFFDHNLDVANRHIARVCQAKISLISAVRDEIHMCCERAISAACDMANNQMFSKRRWYLEIQESRPGLSRDTKALTLCQEGSGARIPFAQFISDHSKKALIDILSGNS